MRNNELEKPFYERRSRYFGQFMRKKNHRSRFPHDWHTTCNLLPRTENSREELSGPP